MLTTKFLKLSGVAVGLAALLAFSHGAMADGFTVSSPQISESSFIGSEQVFAGFGCEGDNVSPAPALPPRGRAGAGVRRQ